MTHSLMAALAALSLPASLARPGQAILACPLAAMLLAPVAQEPLSKSEIP